MVGKCTGLVVEEEEEIMIAPTGSEMMIKRIGRFLLPRSKSIEDVADPAVPELRNAICDGKITYWPPKKVVLEGWRMPQTKWSEWVHTLKPRYEHVWKKSGIFNAVIASTYEIRRHPTIVFALLLYWSSETNTFAFPWSEATLTLEDIMILGDFPVVGEALKSKESLTDKDKDMLTKMIAERKSFNKLSSKKASHYEWIKHYTDPNRLQSNDEIDHVAFLSLWLSRFVFPAHPGKTVSENMFPIAIRLSLGTKIALGPSVLASIYRDMRVLKDHVLQVGGAEMTVSFTLWAPFQLLHIWALEHFVALRKDRPPHLIRAGDPRVSRWTGLDVKFDLMYVVSILESPDEFQWRPYMPHLGNWRPPCFYKDIGNWICLSREDVDNDDMGRSFVLILTPSELVGVDCIEVYLPHRVAMQFGFDQDLPGRVVRANADWETAWTAYDRNFFGIRVYAPPRLFEADCTQSFLAWQQECWSDHSHPKEKLMEQLQEHSQQLKKPIMQAPSPSPSPPLPPPPPPPPSQKGKAIATSGNCQSLSTACNNNMKQQSANNNNSRKREWKYRKCPSYCVPKLIKQDIKRESMALKMVENDIKAARLQKEREIEAEIESIKNEIAVLEDDMYYFEIESPKFNHQKENDCPSLDDTVTQ